jgi:hypothetical protein
MRFVAWRDNTTRGETGEKSRGERGKEEVQWRVR